MSTVIEYYEEHPAECRDFIAFGENLPIEVRLLGLETVPRNKRSPWAIAARHEEFYDWFASRQPIPTIVRAQQIEFVFQVYLDRDDPANDPLNAFTLLNERLEPGVCEKEARALLQTLIRDARNGYSGGHTRSLCPLALTGDDEAIRELEFVYDEGIEICR